MVPPFRRSITIVCFSDKSETNRTQTAGHNFKIEEAGLWRGGEQNLSHNRGGSQSDFVFPGPLTMFDGKFYIYRDDINETIRFPIKYQSGVFLNIITYTLL